MDRRDFLQLAAAVAVDQPRYRTVTPFSPGKSPMPGEYPGKVVRLHSPRCIDEQSETVNAHEVKQMISHGMRTLTGAPNDRDAWAHFFHPKDVVGIKVNCSGAPKIMSSPEIVGEIAHNLVAVGVPATRIYIYERFESQIVTVPYAKFAPAGVRQVTAERSRGSVLGYDPRVFVEVNFFGEEDTRSNLTRLVSDTLTKIINVPNMKEHQASGVTGCLKNIAYGNFSNVARSHRYEKTNTYSFIGTLASVEPLRSRTVLHIMDGLRGVWHGGPFSEEARFRFFPKQMMFGTDPVAMDRLLIDVIEDKRKQEGAPSIFDRSPGLVKNMRGWDPGRNRFIREPGHIEYAAKLGLGVFDLQRINVKKVEL